MKKFEHGGNVYGTDRPSGDWLDFSANINPLGIALAIKNIIVENIDNLVHYPDPKGTELKQAISGFYKVPIENIVLGNGAVELLYVYFHSRRPRRVVIPVPSFNEYERSALACNGDIEYFYMPTEKDYRLKLTDLLKYLHNKVIKSDYLVHLAAKAESIREIYNSITNDNAVDIHAAGRAEISGDASENTIAKAPVNYLSNRMTVILGNPNNPTGQLLPADEVEWFIREAGKLDVDVIVDESFLDFRKDRDSYSVATLVEKCDNLLVLQSLTKFYAIPGLRLGFALANAELVQAMDRGKDPWNVNLLAQKAGVVALAEAEYQKKTRDLIEQEIAYVRTAISKITDKSGCPSVLKPYQPTVNFCMVNIRLAGITSTELVRRMRSKGVLVRDCSNYPGLDNYHIRVAIRGRSENDRMLEVLQEVLKW